MGKVFGRGRRIGWTPRRERAFLAALAEGGNVTTACEESGITRSVAYARRAKDAGFAAAWVLAARAGAAAAEAMASRRDEPPADMVIRRSKKGVTQIAAARAGTWSARAQAAFLRHLAQTCNVRASIRAAGLTTRTVYTHRRLYAAFARAWDAALAEGHARLEMMLVEKATNAVDFTGFDELPPDEAAAARANLEAQGYDAWFAIHLLKTHRDSAEGKPPSRRWGAAQARRKTFDEVRASIVRKIEAIERARELPERDRR